MLTPYYTDDLVTVYHGDCLKILPQLTEQPELCLSDPPYGIGYKHSGKGAAVYDRKHSATKRHSEKIVGDAEPFDPTHLLAINELILWGATNYAHLLPPGVGRWLIWDKADGRYDVDSFGDAELAWHNKGKASRIFRYAWKGVYCVKNGEDNGRRVHPSMKPLGLMKWCIVQAKSAGLLVDPYAGSGSTLVAAKQLGRRIVGIEILEKYCEISARRLSQEMAFAANGI